MEQDAGYLVRSGALLVAADECRNCADQAGLQAAVYPEFISVHPNVFV
jgi:hypothetical protein